MSEPASAVCPVLRVDRLLIQKHKAIRSLDLPAQGLGWGDRIPDLVLVGGANGTGKTTLLETVEIVVRGAASLGGHGALQHTQRVQAEVVFDGAYATPLLEKLWKEILPDKTRPLRMGWSWGNSRTSVTVLPLSVIGSRDDLTSSIIPHELRETIKSGSYVGPRLLMFPSQRQLTEPQTSEKSAGPLKTEVPFNYRWSPPTQWKGSLESILYDARWMDLNAREEGDTSTRFFQSFADEFHAFTEGKRKLVWRRGELVVETPDEHTHGLLELSSGEKQILLLLTELNRLWAPGSLVLIDEPELHLHERWQTHLFSRLNALLKERGGQLWLATQSDHLFRLAEPGSAVILR